MATTTMTGATPSSSPSRMPIPLSKLLLGGLLGGSLAAVANLGVYALARSFQASMVAEFWRGRMEPLTIAAVMFASFLPALIAAGVYALLQRVTVQATRAFVGVMVVAGVVAMIWPITLRGTDLATQVGLAVMIAVATVTVMWALVWQTRTSV